MGILSHFYTCKPKIILSGNWYKIKRGNNNVTFVLMKKLFVIIILGLSQSLLFAQTKEDHDHAVNKFMNYFNQEKYQALCIIFQPNAEGACVWDREHINWVLTCFGKISSATYLAADTGRYNGDLLYRVKCAKKEIVVRCKLDEYHKFIKFEFNVSSPYIESLLKRKKINK